MPVICVVHDPHVNTPAHVSHDWSQALSQQYPSTQNELAHSAGLVHVSPLAFCRMHSLLVQTAPGAQSAALPQLVGHCVSEPSQT
jgi:hypothetical protein